MFLSINCEFLEVFLEKEGGGGGSIIWPLGTIFILSLSFFFLIRKNDFSVNYWNFAFNANGLQILLRYRAFKKWIVSLNVLRD